MISDILEFAGTEVAELETAEPEIKEKKDIQYSAHSIESLLDPQFVDDVDDLPPSVIEMHATKKNSLNGLWFRFKNKTYRNRFCPDIVKDEKFFMQYLLRGEATIQNYNPISPLFLFMAFPSQQKEIMNLYEDFYVGKATGAMIKVLEINERGRIAAEAEHAESTRKYRNFNSQEKQHGENARIKLESKIADSELDDSAYLSHLGSKENSRMRLEAKIAGCDQKLPPTMICLQGLWVRYGDGTYHNPHYPDTVMMEDDFSEFFSNGQATVLDYNPVPVEILMKIFSKTKNMLSKAKRETPLSQQLSQFDIYKTIDQRRVYYTDDGVRVD